MTEPMNAPDRYKATGDYAYPSEEDADGEFVSYDDYEKLRQRCEELEADARRYRWLRDESLGQWQHPIVVHQHKFESLGTMRYIGPLIGNDLDTAIDRAGGGERENGDG
jgi:hypothetical protein